MGKKLRKKSFHKSIKKDFAFYIILYIFSSLLLGFVCSQLFLYGQNQIREKYYDEYRKKIEYIEGKPSTAYHFYNDNDVKIEIHYSLDLVALFTPIDKLKYDILGIASGVVYPLSFIVCLGLVSILFYRKVLQKPLELLGAAADKIADNNLDFTIHYDRPDEFSRLCQSFEKMRSALRDNNHIGNNCVVCERSSHHSKCSQKHCICYRSKIQPDSHITLLYLQIANKQPC